MTSCSLCLPYVFFVLCLFVIWLDFGSAPGQCLPFTFVVNIEFLVQKLNSAALFFFDSHNQATIMLEQKVFAQAAHFYLLVLNLKLTA